ncbi:MAG: anhydro-N-acetylmuramic acid kinase [Flavobacterium sp.]|nr:MAG: anhydro-N-acetylmuramic acid kinase [Flavobacterium sp.]
MNIQNYNVVGVMSGTSLDGIDLAHILLQFCNGKWQFEIHNAETISYDEYWLNKLRDAVGFSADKLLKLNKEYTVHLASVIKDFIATHNISDLDAVCSHGHTILHQPHAGITLQIGNLPEIANLTDQRVVCDFRVQDVELGGQGAPLVPIGDRLLFAEYDYCLNLGGFSNISFEDVAGRIAFDICPVNTVLNFYANKLGLDYDDGGKIASEGKLIDELLIELDSIDFYAQPYPKSLGFEFVKGTILPMIEKYDRPEADKLRTFCEHIAIQIAQVLKSGSMLVTGGGAYNNFLMNRLRHMAPQINIVVPNDKTIQYKEALIFALLGVLRLRGDSNVLSSVTGAERDHSSGNIFEP